MKRLEDIRGGDLAGMSLLERDRLCQQIHDDLRSRLMNSARRILRNEADAEDACQQTFLKCHQYISQGRLKGHLLAWVWTVHIRNSLKLLETRKKDLHRRDDVPMPIRDDSASRRKKLLTGVWQAVESLPPRQREVFVLIHQEGLEPREVAAALGMTYAATRQNYSRARRALQALLMSRLEDES